jgi:quercetin dioxygenase-like cupin family protein
MEQPMTVKLTEAEALKRLVRRSDMVAEKVAFIDCKMPGSHLKENYSLIGPGVTQSSSQVVSLSEPHGFSLGVAAMPAGITNNLHVHYTAETFMIFKGTFKFRWGDNGRDGEVIGETGDVVSMPTWIFRGFSNIGDGDGWIFTALGGDKTGGILWHPHILEVAAEHGLYLTKQNMMVDTSTGAAQPPTNELMVPLDRKSIDAMRHYSVEDMRRWVVTRPERRWSSRALLDSVLTGHEAELAPVVGHGMSQDRDHETPIGYPHGFSLDWIRMQIGRTIGRHFVAGKQVLIVFKGALEIDLNDGADEVTVRANTQDVFSVPAGVWRSYRSVGDEPLEVAVLSAGDHKTRVSWAPEIARAVGKAGYAIDHNGYVADLELLPLSVQKSAGPGT